MEGMSSSRFVSVPTLGLVLDGALLPSLRPGEFEPFVPDTLSVEPWPCGTVTGVALLAWLGAAFPQRPLLGLTARPCSDPDGAPVLGLSPLGSGVALVSTRNLADASLVGVMRHEIGHALGLGHCKHWDCALSQRPHPLPVCGRPNSFCPSCQERWDALCRGHRP